MAVAGEFQRSDIYILVVGNDDVPYYCLIADIARTDDKTSVGWGYKGETTFLIGCHTDDVSRVGIALKQLYGCIRNSFLYFSIIEGS